MPGPTRDGRFPSLRRSFTMAAGSMSLSRKKGSIRPANRMALSRRALYNLLEKPVFTPDQIKKVCQVLEISQKEFVGNVGVDDGGTEYTDVESWKDKYYKLLEDYNQALLELARLRESASANA